MKIDRDYLMKLINLEQRRTAGDRVLSGLSLFIGGALVGAGVALLIAPKSGADLRKELTENGINPILQRFESPSTVAPENTPRA